MKRLLIAIAMLLGCSSADAQSLGPANLLVPSSGNINFGTGDILLTHSSNFLTMTGGDLALTGDIIVGNTAAVTLGSGTPAAQILSNDSATALGIGTFSNNINESRLVFAKSRNTTIGSHTIVNDKDTLGSMEFWGSDGSTYAMGGGIELLVNDTPGLNSMPSVMVLRVSGAADDTGTNQMFIFGSTDISTEGVTMITSDPAGGGGYPQYMKDQFGGSTPALQVVDSTANGGSIGIARFSADSGGPTLKLGKSRGAWNNTAQTYTISQLDDQLGSVIFHASDGTNFDESARIRAFVDGDIATAGDTLDTPGRLAFATTLDGSGTPTDRMVIKNDGGIIVGPNETTSPGQGNLMIDAAGDLMFAEAEANGDNTITFLGVASIASDRTCQLVDGTAMIPDSCVGDGTDGGGTLADLDYVDITVTGSGLTWNIDSGVVGTTELTDGSIAEVDLNAIDSPSDEECLTYEGGNFEWQTCASASIGDGTYGDIVVSGSGTVFTVGADAVALGTDTTGVYVAQVADGTGIDGTCNSETCTYTPTLDLTEITPTATFGAGAFTTLTFDAGASDTAFEFATGTMTVDIGGTNETTLTSTAFSPGVNDGNALGTAALAWADLFFATGGTIEWDGGTTNTMTCTGGNCSVEGNAFYRVGGTDVAVADGGTGASSLTDLITLTTHTTGNYVATVTEPTTGIDGACSSEGCAYAPSLDMTEINTFTLGAGAATGIIFDAGASDPAIETATGTFTIDIGGTNELVLNATNLTPGANDGNALGVSGTAWADLFLAAGGLIEFDGGTTNSLTCTGGNCTIEGNGLYRAGGTDVAVADGGTGASALTDLITLTTHTTGNYVGSVADGTGVDGTAAGEGATYTPTLDLTEISEGTGIDLLATTISLDFTEITTVTWGTNNYTTEVYSTDGVDLTWDYSTVDGAAVISGGGTSPILGIEDGGQLRFFEEDAGGSNTVSFIAPAAVTSDRTCQLVDGSAMIPDACVGDGSDAGAGGVSISGTPADNQVAIWTSASAVEGDAAFTFNTTNDDLIIAASGNLLFGAITILDDAAGTMTLDNIDALGATTESTVEAAIDTLANLTSVQGVSLGTITAVGVSILDNADPAAHTIVGFDNTGNTYVDKTLGTGITTDADSVDLDADLVTWAGVTPGTGVATWIATPSSANLITAVTDETGSGALVFGTAPDLTISATTETNIEAALDTLANVTSIGGDVTAGGDFTSTDDTFVGDDLTLSSTGALINIGPTADCVITHSSNTLTLTGCTAVGFGSGAQTPWTSDIDADQFSLLDMDSIEWGTGTDTTMLRSGAGDVSVEGKVLVRAGRRTITLMAGAGTLPSGGAILACTQVLNLDSGANDVFLRVCNFDAAADNAIYFTVTPPKSADESVDLAARIDWTSTTTTDATDDVIWTMACVAFGNDDPLDGNAFPTVDTVTDTQTAAGDFLSTSEITTLTPAGTWTQGDALVCRVTRDADNASDNFNGNAQLIAVQLYFTLSASTDD